MAQFKRDDLMKICHLVSVSLKIVDEYRDEMEPHDEIDFVQSKLSQTIETLDPDKVERLMLKLHEKNVIVE